MCFFCCCDRLLPSDCRKLEVVDNDNDVVEAESRLAVLSWLEESAELRPNGAASPLFFAVLVAPLLAALENLKLVIASSTSYGTMRSFSHDKAAAALLPPPSFCSFEIGQSILCGSDTHNTASRDVANVPMKGRLGSSSAVILSGPHRCTTIPLVCFRAGKRPVLMMTFAYTTIMKYDGTEQLALFISYWHHIGDISANICTTCSRDV